VVAAIVCFLSGIREWLLIGILVPEYKLTGLYSPNGDQPTAIACMVSTAASVIKPFLAQLAQAKHLRDRKALVLAHNKTLAAQLCNAFLGGCLGIIPKSPALLAFHCVN